MLPFDATLFTALHPLLATEDVRTIRGRVCERNGHTNVTDQDAGMTAPPV